MEKFREGSCNVDYKSWKTEFKNRLNKYKKSLDGYEEILKSEIVNIEDLTKKNIDITDSINLIQGSLENIIHIPKLGMGHKDTDLLFSSICQRIKMTIKSDSVRGKLQSDSVRGKLQTLSDGIRETVRQPGKSEAREMLRSFVFYVERHLKLNNEVEGNENLINEKYSILSKMDQRLSKLTSNLSSFKYSLGYVTDECDSVKTKNNFLKSIGSSKYQVNEKLIELITKDTDLKNFLEELYYFNLNQTKIRPQATAKEPVKDIQEMVKNIRNESDMKNLQTKTKQLMAEILNEDEVKVGNEYERLLQPFINHLIELYRGFQYILLYDQTKQIKLKACIKKKMKEYFHKFEQLKRLTKDSNAFFNVKQLDLPYQKEVTDARLSAEKEKNELRESLKKSSVRVDKPVSISKGMSKLQAFRQQRIKVSWNKIKALRWVLSKDDRSRLSKVFELFKNDTIYTCDHVNLEKKMRSLKEKYEKMIKYKESCISECKKNIEDTNKLVEIRKKELKKCAKTELHQMLIWP